MKTKTILFVLASLLFAMFVMGCDNGSDDDSSGGGSDALPLPGLEGHWSALDVTNTVAFNGRAGAMYVTGAAFADIPVGDYAIKSWSAGLLTLVSGKEIKIDTTTTNFLNVTSVDDIPTAAAVAKTSAMDEVIWDNALTTVWEVSSDKVTINAGSIKIEATGFDKTYTMLAPAVKTSTGFTVLTTTPDNALTTVYATLTLTTGAVTGEGINGLTAYQINGDTVVTKVFLPVAAAITSPIASLTSIGKAKVVMTADKVTITSEAEVAIDYYVRTAAGSADANIPTDKGLLKFAAVATINTIAVPAATYYTYTIDGVPGGIYFMDASKVVANADTALTLLTTPDKKYANIAVNSVTAVPTGDLKGVTGLSIVFKADTIEVQHAVGVVIPASSPKLVYKFITPVSSDTLTLSVLATTGSVGDGDLIEHLLQFTVNEALNNATLTIKAVTIDKSKWETTNADSDLTVANAT